MRAVRDADRREPRARDRAEEHARVLWHTYRIMATWPAALAVFPAHLSAGWPITLGTPATRSLGEVRHVLHAFHLEPDAFVERLLARLPPRPPHHQDILEKNRHGLPCDPDEVGRLEAGGNQCVVPP
jgi:hypothetical protein